MLTISINSFQIFFSLNLLELVENPCDPPPGIDSSELELDAAVETSELDGRIEELDGNSAEELIDDDGSKELEGRETTSLDDELSLDEELDGAKVVVVVVVLSVVVVVVVGVVVVDVVGVVVVVVIIFVVLLVGRVSFSGPLT
jgi:hypothetical protein